MRGRDSHGPSRADSGVRATRQRFWPVEPQPDMADPPGPDHGLLYTWRRQIQEGMAEHRSPVAPEGWQARETTQPAALQRRVVAGVIEIDLPNGVCVRVDNHVDPVALRRVLDALLTR